MTFLLEFPYLLLITYYYKNPHLNIMIFHLEIKGNMGLLGDTRYIIKETENIHNKCKTLLYWFMIIIVIIITILKLYIMIKHL